MFTRFSQSKSTVVMSLQRAALLSILLAALMLSCSVAKDPEQAGMEMITANSLKEHIKFISHDLLEGRDTGSRGEMISQEYMAAQFAMNGVMPGAEDSSYFQNFELITKMPRPATRFEFTAGGSRIRPVVNDDFVALTSGAEAQVRINSGLVFGGYGITAPEYEWDDYGDIDLENKVVLVMWSEPESEDSTFFEGKTQSEFAGLDYKSRTIRDKGASGIMIVFDPEKIQYPWAAMSGFFSWPQMELPPDPENSSNMKMFSLITMDLARRLFSAAGRNFDEDKQRAETSEFSAVELDAAVNARLSSDIKTTPVRNVVGFVPGVQSDEYIIYTAHSDHMGIGAPDITGDNIINGAIDNASGCAALLEIGKAFANLPSPPQRSIILLTVTAEEKGLIGSRYYADNPIYPLEKTLAVINHDGVLPWGKSLDVGMFGYERSTLGELLAEVATEHGMTVGEDPMPEENFYMRSDHYSFAQKGVPGGMLINGLTFEGKPEGWGLDELKRWLQEEYHHPSDEFTDDWDMRSVEQIVRISFQMGYRLTTATEWPEWYDGQPYKKARDEALQK